MPEAKPRQPKTSAPTTRDRTPASAPGQAGNKTKKLDQPFVWPRDRSAPCTDTPEWDCDPEAPCDA